MAKNRIKGITVEIGGDTTNLAESLEKVDKNISNTQSQLKDVEKLLKLDPTNTELLSQKQKLLGDAVKDTRDRLDSLKTASKEAAKTKDNYDAWKEKITPIQTEITKTTDELKKLKERSKEANEQLSRGEISQEQYDDLQREIKETSDKLKDLKKSKEDTDKEFGHPISQEEFDRIQREIFETEQDLQRLQNEANNSRTALINLGKSGESLQNVGEKISGVGQSLLPVTAGIVGVGTLAVKTGAEFDSAMSKVSAVSGATGDDLDTLRAKAREMGSETKFSSSEAAEAMNYMAMAGWKTNDMLNGIEGIMYLAAASGEELGTTSDIVTDALTALGYTAGDAGHFADVLAAASSNANTNVSLMGESFQYCAPIAGSMKASAEDLAVALGLMANAGIKGSQSGNSLKNALVNLIKPTDAQKAAMENLGLMTTETARIIDQADVDKAQAKVADKTRDLEKAQNNYNAALEKYGENSYQLKNKLLDLQGAESKLTEAQDALTKAQQGTIETVGTGQSAFTDEYGNMKSLKEIMDVLRSSLGAVNVELVDSEGNAHEYDDIITELSETEEGLTQAEQLKNAAIIFGKQNLSGMLAIINASEDDYNDLTESIYNCDGTAQNMAETMQDNLSGQLTILMSQLQELAISFAEILMPAIRSIVTKIQGLMDKLNALSPQTKETIVKIALIAASLGPLLIVVGKAISMVGMMMTVISKIPTIITKVKGGFTAVKAALTGATGTMLAVVAIIGVLVAAFVNLWKNNEDFRNNITAIWENIKRIFTGFTQNIVDRLNALGFDFEIFGEVVKAIWNGLCTYLAPVLEGAFDFIADTLDVVLDILLGLFDVFAGIFTGDWETAWNGLKEIFVGIWDWIVETLGFVLDTICSLFGTDLATVSEFWEDTWTNIKNFFVNTWNTFQENFQTEMDAIKAFWTDIWNAVSGFFTTIWTSIKNFFVNIWTSIYTTVSSKIQLVKNIIVTVWNAIYGFISPLLEAFRYLFETIFEAVKILIGKAMDWISTKIQDIWNAVVGFITPILEGIRDFFTNIFEDVKNTVGNVMDSVSGKIHDIWNGIVEFITPVLEGIKNFFDNTWNDIKADISEKMDIIKTVVSTVWDTIKSNISEKLNAVKMFVSTVWDTIKSNVSVRMNIIKNTVSNVWENVKSAVSEKITGIKTTITDGFNNAVDFVKGLADDAWNWGSDIISGIVDGIKSKIRDITDAVTNVADTIREYLHFSVPDKGPLTDYESWMPDFISGLVKGINKNKKYIENAVNGVADAMKFTMNSNFAYSFDGISGAMISGGTSGTVNNYYQTDNSRTVNQTNNSPKPLSRLEIYRQTRNAMNV